VKFDMHPPGFEYPDAQYKLKHLPGQQLGRLWSYH